MLYHEQDYKGYHIQIKLDDLPQDPRKDFEPLGNMICFHKQYKLGDEHNMSVEEAQVIECSKNVVSLPLYIYAHSGITINTTGFSCPWDSGRLGFIYIEKEKIRKEYGWKYLTKKRIEKIEQYLRNEVEIYDQYIRGDVYGYEITKGDEEIDSLWGMFGYDYTLAEAKRYVDDLIENSEVQLELQFA